MDIYIIALIIITLLIANIRIIQLAVIEDRKLKSKIVEYSRIHSFGLSRDDFDFLMELQHEMLTQDHVSQAAPRFWVIATDKFEELGTEDAFDGTKLYSSEEADTLCEGDMDSILEYVTEHYSDEMEDFVFTNQGRHYLVEFGEGEDREKETIFCSEELLDFLKEHGVITDDYEIIYYRNVHHVYPNTMFLTNRSCKEHIKANYYHYNEDAHSYAMTAWRSPEVEKLWNILDKIDWKTMKEEAYGTQSETKRTFGKTDVTESSGSSK